MTPALLDSANYIQLSNAQLTAPGTGGNRQAKLPLGQKHDHSILLRDSSFLGLVAISKQEHEDVIGTVTVISKNMSVLVDDIDKELLGN